MKLITRQTNANEVVLRWDEQYGSGGYGKDKLIILEKLKALGPNPNPDDVDQIIGNNSWTSVHCNECDDFNAEIVVMLGEEPDYESSTACVCLKCLKEASSLIRDNVHQKLNKN